MWQVLPPAMPQVLPPVMPQVLPPAMPQVLPPAMPQVLPLIPLPLPAPNADEEAIELTQEIMKLPPKQREVILLYYYHGLTGKEIAKALGISGAAVSKRLKQAKNQLHFALKGGEMGEK